MDKGPRVESNDSTALDKGQATRLGTSTRVLRSRTLNSTREVLRSRTTNHWILAFRIITDQSTKPGVLCTVEIAYCNQLANLSSRIKSKQDLGSTSTEPKRGKTKLTILVSLPLQKAGFGAARNQLPRSSLTNSLGATHLLEYRTNSRSTE